jgi:hypothetical protein
MRELLAIVIAFALLMFVLGWMNATDIMNCVERGNTYEQCSRAFNR